MTAPVHVTVQTSDPDETVAAVERGYGYRVRISGDAMNYRQDALIGDVITVSDVDLGAAFAVDGEPGDALLLMHLGAGAYTFDPWGRQHTFGAGGAFVVPNDLPLRFELDDVRATTCSFSASDFRQVALDAFDLPEATVHPGSVGPVDEMWAREWPRRVEAYRRSVLGTPSVYAEPLLRAEATRQLLVDAVFAFGLLRPSDLTADESAAVRRARTWMDEHLREPVTIQDVAKAARISPRGLQAAFRRQRGDTPMGYLRRARLAGARADLLAANGGVTVRAVAASWGFSNAGRFASAYARVYGEQPGRTLDR